MDNNMNRDNLRKIEICDCDNYKLRDYGKNPKAYFHQWGFYQNEDGAEPMAIIEMEDGRVFTINPEYIKFIS